MHCPRPPTPHLVRIARRSVIRRSRFGAACDAIADAFIRTPAAHRVGSLRVFADPKPTKVGHLRPWVNDLAAAHCSSARLVLRMHPPASHDEITNGEPTVVQAVAAEDLDAPWTVTFALQSKADPSLLIDAVDYWHAPTEVMDRLGSQAEATLLSGLRVASGLVPAWRDLLDDVAPSAAILDGDELDTFLDQLDAFDDAGIDVRWPVELVAPKLERRLVVSAGAPAGGLASSLSLESLLEVDWEFLLDGLPLTPDELAVLADAKRAVVSLRGRWVRLDRETLKRLRAPTPALNITSALAVALGAQIDLTEDANASELAIGEDETIEIQITGALDELVLRLQTLTGQRLEVEPAELHTVLRDYQRRGLAWMADLCQLGFGGCLADDMGLGKTVQVLALHARRRGALKPSGRRW